MKKTGTYINYNWKSSMRDRSILKPFGVVTFVAVLFAGFSESAQAVDEASRDSGLSQTTEENLDTIALEKPKKEQYRREANGFNSPTVDGPWRRSIALSLWLPSRIRLNAQGKESGSKRAVVKKDLSWLVDGLEYEVPLEFELRKGTFGIYAHLLAFRIDGEVHEPPINIEYDDHGFLLDTGMSYELGTWALGSGPDAPTLTLEPFGGLRWLYDPVEIDLAVGPVGKTENVRFITYVPVAGLRAFLDFDEHWNARFDGDYGGFGVDNNDETWNLRVLAGYRFHSWLGATWNVQAGYRWMRLFDLNRSQYYVRGDLNGPLMMISAEF
jgi:hypothetical protein